MKYIMTTAEINFVLHKGKTNFIRCLFQSNVDNCIVYCNMGSACRQKRANIKDLYFMVTLVFKLCKCSP